MATASLPSSLSLPFFSSPKPHIFPTKSTTFKLPASSKQAPLSLSNTSELTPLPILNLSGEKTGETLMEVEENVEQSGRNIGTLKLLTPRSLNLYDVLNSEKLVFTKGVVEYLNNMYGVDSVEEGEEGEEPICVAQDEEGEGEVEDEGEVEEVDDGELETESETQQGNEREGEAGGGQDQGEGEGREDEELSADDEDEAEGTGPAEDVAE